MDVPHIFHFNTLAAKVLGAIGSVAGGLAIGKEGPFVHAGAAIAAIISQVRLASCVRSWVGVGLWVIVFVVRRAWWVTG